MGILKRIIAGLILIALGGALAIYMPPMTQESAEEAAAVPELTQREWNQATLGAEYLLVGEVSRKNKTFDRGIVIGQREAWATKDNKTGWTFDVEYRQPLFVKMKGVNHIEVKLDSIAVTGDEFVEESPENMRWSGIKMSQRIVVHGVLTSLSPPTADQKVGTSIFVGSPDEWRDAQMEEAKMMTYIFWALGAVFAVGGAATILTAFSRKKA